ncbi:MAG: hypothetical protein ACKVP3_05635 [Hyphomicrobiaceae bacterium]
MADPHVLTGLVAKRREIAGKIEHLQDQLRQHVIDLDHVDAAIHIFDPSIELEEIKSRPVPPVHAAFRGEVSRILLAALRNAKKPLTTAELAQRVMAERGLDANNARLLKTIGKRTGACLRHWRSRGVASAQQGPGQYQLWQIVR